MTSTRPRILIMGGTGFVGQELGLHLVRQGYDLTLLSRRPEQVRGQLAFPCTTAAWDGVTLPSAAVEGCHAVINLVGEGIGDQPWTKTRRAALVDSRVRSVAALAGAVAGATRKPSVVIQASAIGYYGDRGDDELAEGSQPGEGFLADTCVAWEGSLAPLAKQGVRLVVLRFGVVLGLTGGALPKILAVYSKGLGGPLGGGQQWTSWIHIQDLVRLVTTALQDALWQGVVNAVAPTPCRDHEFSATLAACGRYRRGASVPKIALRLALGRRADLVLASTRVVPAAALARGFSFQFPTIRQALAGLVGDAVQDNLRRLVFQQWSPMATDDLWSFFARAENLERLTPTWLNFGIKGMSTAEIGLGTTIRYQLRLHGLPIDWESLISRWSPGQVFVDEQTRGPYAVWHHTHLFEALAGGTLITDAVQYRLPMAPVGELVAGGIVSGDVGRIFAYRRRAVAALALGGTGAAQG